MPRLAREGNAAGTPAWRSLVTGARLGWVIESNWTDPFLFAVYAVARPVGAALVLVAIVWLVGGGGRPDYVGYLVVGSACWTFVGGGMSGLVWAVLDDRERYRMLKYVVVSTAALLPFLVGRARGPALHGRRRVSWSRCSSACFLLGVQIDVWAIDWPLFVASMTVGLIAIVSLGLAVAGLCLTTRRESWSYPEAIAGGLYLLSGAIFPPDVLPPVPPARRPRAAHHVVAGGGPPGPPRASPHRTCWRVSTTRWSCPPCASPRSCLHSAAW